MELPYHGYVQWPRQSCMYLRLPARSAFPFVCERKNLDGGKKRVQTLTEVKKKATRGSNNVTKTVT